MWTVNSATPILIIRQYNLFFKFRYTGKHGYGEFLQISGVRVIYDLKATQGSRVIGISILCTDCEVPAYQPLVEEKEYKVVLNAFLAEGGDDYGMLKNESLSSRSITTDDLEAARKYMSSESPIRQGIEGRITFINLGDPNSSVNLHSSIGMISFIFFIVFKHFCTL